MGAAVTWQPGAVVVDTAGRRVGVVVSVEGELVRLRPGGGWEQWTAPSTALRPASATDRLRTKVADANALRRWLR
jgi:hypothetical protein